MMTDLLVFAGIQQNIMLCGKGRKKLPKGGFSLVELAIVLVILGLLTGGILAGQSLIRASQLRAVHTEYQRFVAAGYAFRDKYFALPGDMTNATKFWGTANADPATCKTTASTTTTCDGDGSGMVTSAAPGADERFRFWQQLSLAGLIEGQYRGINTSFDATSQPASKLSNGSWFISWNGQQAGNTTWFPGNYGNGFQFITTTAPYAIITPEEAWNIDMKLDDGLPGTGKVMGWKGDATYLCTNLANNATHTGGTYNLSRQSRDCFLFFQNNF